MTRTGIVTAVLPLCVAATLSADVTIRSQTTGKGLGMSTNAPSTTYVKGLKMRIDTVTGGTTRS
ncbi:MAG: hypothetical protein FJW23_12000, partial [Acidimicrobiia bacterium]|nr:hypothetical protein [Acidimicrobiia bacterium]